MLELIDGGRDALRIALVADLVGGCIAEALPSKPNRAWMKA
jgi:hypothetical protein